MTHASVLLDDGFPHGTIQGYRQGCRTNHCPAPVPCVTVDRLARSDWEFNRLVTSGATGEALAAWIDAQRVAEAVSDQPVKRSKPKPKPTKPAPAPRRTVEHASRGRTWPPAAVEQLKQLTADHVPVARIAEIMGRTPSAISMKRKRLNIGLKPKGHGTVAAYARGCRCVECHEAARAYWRIKARARTDA